MLKQLLSRFSTIPLTNLRLGLLLAVGCLCAQPAHADEHARSSLIGRWDLVVEGVDGQYPSWLEVTKSGHQTLVGRYVGQFGSARPIAKVETDGGTFQFTIPPQWEQRPDDVTVRGTLERDMLSGTTTDDSGRTIHFRGTRAPALRYDEPRWDEPIELFNGKDLQGWTPLLDGVANGWVVKEGLLINMTPGNNLATKRQFGDFKLHAEFRYPQGSNSGIYLRGRYEMQIEDNYGDAPDSHKIGGIYGFLTPSINAAKPAGEWQSYEVTLVGRVVTVHLNGQRVIDRQAIPGITGGAIDSNEAAQGPIYLQGDHGPVEFRMLTITPAKRPRRTDH